MQLTNSTHVQASPNIGDDNHVAWNEMGVGGNIQIYYYDGMTTTQLSSNLTTNYYVKVNNVGSAVWSGKPIEDDDYSIYLYDSNNVTKFTNDNYGNYLPDINDNGQIAWLQDTAGGQTPQMEQFGQVMFYDGQSIRQLTDGSINYYGLKINNLGQIVCLGGDDDNREIYFYNGANFLQLTNNAWDDWGVDLNNNGLVTWSSCINGLDEEIMLYDGFNTFQLTDNDFEDIKPSINLHGNIAWVCKGDQTAGIYLASVVPEPSSFFLLAFSGMITAFMKKRRK